MESETETSETRAHVVAPRLVQSEPTKTLPILRRRPRGLGVTSERTQARRRLERAALRALVPFDEASIACTQGELEALLAAEKELTIACFSSRAVRFEVPPRRVCPSLRLIALGRAELHGQGADELYSFDHSRCLVGGLTLIESYDDAELVVSGPGKADAHGTSSVSASGREVQVRLYERARASMRGGLAIAHEDAEVKVDGDALVVLLDKATVVGASNGTRVAAPAVARANKRRIGTFDETVAVALYTDDPPTYVFDAERERYEIPDAAWQPATEVFS